MEAVGIYLRLSRDDERQGESASIESQRAYLTQYAAARGWAVAREYADDGVSGLTFDRPGFRELLDDIDRGLIHTVLTKDLSRLGRDQIWTAYYYQIYFPRKGVRYIAVSEGLDTRESGSAGALFPFLTAANDFYTADVSRKVRAALTARKRAGRFIGAQAPFGYAKDPARPGRLAVDEAAAEVVRELFRRYLQSGSVAGVAKELTEGGFPTPAQYRGGGGQARFPGVWSDRAVRRILTNPTYAGHLTQNRRVKINYKLDQYRDLPPEEWITVPNTHPAIVDQEAFDRAQALLGLRSYRAGGGGGHLLTGLAFCGKCGSPMTYVRESPARTYMVCQGWRRGGRLGLCTSHCVREDRVTGTLRQALQEAARGINPQALAAACREDTGDGQRRLERTRQQLDRQEAVMGRLYEDRAAGTLTEAEFAALLAQARKKRSALETRLAEWEDAPRMATSAVEDAEALLSFRDLDRGTVAALVERVVIGENKTVEIVFRFRPPVSDP